MLLVLGKLFLLQLEHLLILLVKRLIVSHLFMTLVLLMMPITGRCILILIFRRRLVVHFVLQLLVLVSALVILLLNHRSRIVCI